MTGLNTREGWPEGMRLIVRRVKPSRRHLGKLTAFEKKTGWRYSVTATNIRHMWGIAGSHQIQFLDVLHRDHAEVEDRVRTNKAMGLRTCRPQVLAEERELDARREPRRRSRRLAAAADPARPSEDLADAEPDTMRFRLYHLPARLAHHARRRHLRIERTWPWAQTFTTSWRRLNKLPAVT